MNVTLGPEDANFRVICNIGNVLVCVIRTYSAGSSRTPALEVAGSNPAVGVFYATFFFFFAFV